MVFFAVYALVMPLAVGLLAWPKAREFLVSNTVAASWAQAVGGFGAVCAALFVAWWEGTRSARETASALSRYRQAAAAVGALLEELIDEEADNLLTAPDYYAHMSPEPLKIELAADTLAAFDPTKLEHPAGAVALVSLRYHAGRARRFGTMAAEQFLANRATSTEFDCSVEDWRRDVSVAYAALRDCCVN